MSYGLIVKLPSGEVLYDSSAEYTLMFVDERVIAGSSVGSGISFNYPALTGKKIAAFLQSPFNTGDIFGSLIQSCRISYPSGVPTVSVFFDQVAYSGAVRADGLLQVFNTGAAQ